MKILVFDDSLTNAKAAAAQLKDHDVKVVLTYDEAQVLVAPRLDLAKYKQIMEGKGYTNPTSIPDYFECRGKPLEEVRVERKEAREAATVYPDFDVVLTDLLVPASEQSQGGDSMGRYVGEEMPVGVFIALLAAKHGAKYVAVFTDSSHHSHPASACFDAFNVGGGEQAPVALNVGDCKVFFVNNRVWVNQFDPSDLGTPFTSEQCAGRTDTVRAKNWKALLDYIVTK